MILFYYVSLDPRGWIFDAERFPSFGTIFVAVGPIGVAFVYAPWRTWRT